MGTIWGHEIMKSVIAYIINFPGQNKQFFLNNPHNGPYLEIYSAHAGLKLTMPWANSADNKLMIFFLKNRIWHFMQVVSKGDNLHELSNPIF